LLQVSKIKKKSFHQSLSPVGKSEQCWGFDAQTALVPALPSNAKRSLRSNELFLSPLVDK